VRDKKKTKGGGKEEKISAHSRGTSQSAGAINGSLPRLFERKKGPPEKKGGKSNDKGKKEKKTLEPQGKEACWRQPAKPEAENEKNRAVSLGVESQTDKGKRKKILRPKKG